TAPQLERAVGRATKAFKSWCQQSLAVRRRHLRALGRTLRSQAPRLALLITREMGKPITQARAEIEKCAVACDYYAETGYRALQPEQPPGAPAGSQVVFEPLGILLAIMPWNFPFWQLFRAAAPALLAGNVVLLKHASNVSGCALANERVVRAAGLPAGVLQTLLV